MRYFIGGYTWNGESQFERFIEDGIWENGYDEDKYSELFLEISVGDYFALKSTFVRGRKPNAKSYLRISQIGRVTEIISKSAIKIDWTVNKEFDLTDIKWYANTLEEISFGGDIKRIFFQAENIEIMKGNTQLLKYKKQIILQGPPGTGKTRLAKEIALQIIGNNEDINLNNYLKKDLSIPNASGTEDYYLLEKVTENSVELSSERATKKWSASFNKIQEKLSQLHRGETPKNKGGDDPYVLAVAKYVFKNLKNNSNALENNAQFKLIQFHPSYTYEDFVQGIVAESKGERIEYKNVNKTLGLFAKEALANFKASTNDSPEANIEAWIDEKFEFFKNEIDAKLPEDEITLSGDITIFEVTDSHFKYAEKWKTPGYLKIVEFKKLIKAVLQNELALSNKQLDKEKFIHAHYRYTYYNALLKIFFDEYKYKKETIKVEPKNYVLIIDEINRANLSSVLGELIYALEYRGEEVESMYEVDGLRKLILPPNLYIIGTMNTADRSVGHIDYAIRRRFAFVDVLPKKLVNDEQIIFKDGIFKIVSELFIKNYDEYINDESVDLMPADTLFSDFKPQDVWLGHSYFIQKKDKNDKDEEILIPEKFSTRIQYEIIPILEEYIKDGILKESARGVIKALKATVESA